MITVEIYRLDVTNSQLVFVDEIVDFQSLSWVEKLNNKGVCSFSLPLYSPKSKQSSLYRHRNIVAIKKGSTIVWAGAITSVTYDAKDVSGIVTVMAEDWLSYLSRRVTSRISPSQGVSVNNAVLYNQVDAGTIAWDLIDSSQNLTNGYLAISQGNADATVNRDRTYYDKIIAEAIVQLSGVIGGFDFDWSYVQDSNKRLTGVLFNVYSQRGSYRTSLPILKIGENVNLASFATQRDIVNYAVGLGAGTGSGVLRSEQSDTSSITSFGLREKVLPAKDISVNSSLDESTLQSLIDMKAERYFVELELIPGSNIDGEVVIPGDYLSLDLRTTPTSVIDYKNQARCIEIAHRVSSGGNDFITLRFEIIK